MHTRSSGNNRIEFLKCSLCTVHMRGSQTVHVHSCMPSILCTRCALGSLTSISYNTWYSKYTAIQCIQYLTEELERREQREQRENDAIVAVIVDECEKHRIQKQENVMDANSALIDLASSSRNGNTGNTTDSIDWIGLIKEATSE